MVAPLDQVAASVWAAVGGDPPEPAHLRLSGPRRLLPSCFDVTGFATGAVATAHLGVAAVVAARTGDDAPPVAVGTREASAAFVCERLLAPTGWELPAIWDPIAGDYQAADGWVKLHTNYASHKAAATGALGLPPDATRAKVAAVVATRTADEVEQAVVDAGGCAAAMRTRSAWTLHPQGRVVADEPAVRIVERPGERPLLRVPAGGRPLTGVKVLDLTRVIAGPVCTRFLAAHGAAVLRIDPPGFEEVGALLPETTAGKRSAWLDLSTPSGRDRFLSLVAEADVVVHGLRPGAMERHGLGPDELRAANPTVVTARLDAYGWQGPWAGRRGFDSLVQMSCGIAAAGMAAAGTAKPKPLPAQALDHGAGHLMAGAVARVLASGRPADVTASLVGVANLLVALPDPEGMDIVAAAWGADDREARTTEWGPAMAAPLPGALAGWPMRLDLPAGPLGRHAPAFAR